MIAPDIIPTSLDQLRMELAAVDLDRQPYVGRATRVRLRAAFHLMPPQDQMQRQKLAREQQRLMVAQAIYSVRSENLPWDELNDGDKQLYLDMADAAVTAMHRFGARA
jgi:hypothetical protein